MGPPEKPKEIKKVDINSLMSPPDPYPTVESFSHIRDVDSASATLRPSDATAHVRGHLNGKDGLPISPPVSPYRQPIATADPSNSIIPQGSSIKDPVLYPHDDHQHITSPAHSPLFAPAELLENRRLVDQHVRNRSPSTFTDGKEPPRPEEYELVLNCRPQVMAHYRANPKEWLRRSREGLKADTIAKGVRRYPKLMPALKPNTAKAPKLSTASRVNKPVKTIKGVSSVRQPRDVAPATALGPSGRISATPEPSRRIVAPNREDRDYHSLPDICPPLSSLPTKGNSLKVDWKGSPIDLHSDPDAHLLHPDELLLAGNLRLDCATYLTSKRRMFLRRLRCLQIPKEFRKTDAQQACKIDVNKASKLWTAFEKVGWLDEKWVRPYVGKYRDIE